MIGVSVKSASLQVRFKEAGFPLIPPAVVTVATNKTSSNTSLHKEKGNRGTAGLCKIFILFHLQKKGQALFQRLPFKTK